MHFQREILQTYHIFTFVDPDQNGSHLMNPVNDQGFPKTRISPIFCTFFFYKVGPVTSFKWSSEPYKGYNPNCPVIRPLYKGETCNSIL